MKNKKQSIKICVLSIICVIMVFLMDMLGCNYWLRSGIKIACVVTTCLLCGDNIINYFKNPKWHEIKFALGLGFTLISFACLIVFPILKHFDFSKLTQGLDKMSIDADSYWFVTTYIVLINSCLEEILFRGLCCKTLERYANKRFAWFFSIGLFSVYHLTMLINIMQPFLICLCLFGLSLAGLIFTLLNRKNNNIYNSWIVHGLANVAINSIGWMLLKGVV